MVCFLCTWTIFATENSHPSSYHNLLRLFYPLYFVYLFLFSFLPVPVELPLFHGTWLVLIEVIDKDSHCSLFSPSHYEPLFFLFPFLFFGVKYSRSNFYITLYSTAPWLNIHYKGSFNVSLENLTPYWLIKIYLLWV